MQYVVPVQGTGGWSNDKGRPDWWKVGDKLHTYLKTLGIDYHYGGDPYVWNTDVNGLRTFYLIKKLLRFGRATAKHSDWISSARALRFALDQLPPRKRNGIGHSHGGQVWLYAAEQDADNNPNRDEPYINFLLTIGTPIRKDMFDVLRRGRQNVRVWYHIQDVDQDWTQWLGSVGDSLFGWIWGRREWPDDAKPDRIFTPEEIGHSGILKNEKSFHLLDDLRVFEPILKERYAIRIESDSDQPAD